MCCLFFKYLRIFQIFLLLISNNSALIREYSLCDFSPSKFVKTRIVAKHMVHLDQWFIVHIKWSIFCSGQSHCSSLPYTFWLSWHLSLIIEKVLLKPPAVPVDLWVFHFIAMRFASCIPNLSDSMHPKENGYVFLMKWPFYLMSLIIILVLKSNCLGLIHLFKHESDKSRSPGL